MLSVCRSTWSNGGIVSTAFSDNIVESCVISRSAALSPSSVYLRFSTYDLQFERMKMDLPTQTISYLNITLTITITITITSITIAIVTIYFASSYRGYPLAQFILHFTQPTRSLSQRKNSDGNSKEHEVARRLGAMLSLSLCLFVLMLEIVFRGS